MKKFITIISTIFTILFAIVISFYIGYRGGSLINKTSDYHAFLKFAVFIFVFYLSYVLQIVIHEGGHLIGGLLSKWDFISFRIGTFAFVKDENNKIILKRMKIQGTGGQCLMCPPKIDPENCPYFLYNLAGGLANLILGAIALLICYFLPDNFFKLAFLEPFGVMGVYLAATNLIPLRIGGVQNDGYNLFNLKTPVARRCFNLTLTTNAILTNSASYTALPADLVKELKETDFNSLDLSNSIIANAYQYQGLVYIAEGDLKKYYEIQLHTIETKDMLPIFIKESECEALFCEIVKQEPKEVIEKRYTKELKKYIKSTLSYPSRNRLMYAYYKLYLKDEAKAETYFQQLKKVCSKHLIKAEANLELEIIEKIRAGQISF